MVPDSRTVEITARGRKSGEPRSVTVWFVPRAGGIAVESRDAGRNWVRNLTADPRPIVRIAGKTFRGDAARIDDPAELDELGRRFAEKYFPARVARWLGAVPAVGFRIDLVEVPRDAAP